MKRRASWGPQAQIQTGVEGLALGYALGLIESSDSVWDAKISKP